MHAPMRGWCAARAMWNRENTAGVSRAESDCQRLAGVLHVAVPRGEHSDFEPPLYTGGEQPDLSSLLQLLLRQLSQIKTLRAATSIVSQNAVPKI